MAISAGLECLSEAHARLPGLVIQPANRHLHPATADVPGNYGSSFVPGLFHGIASGMIPGIATTAERFPMDKVRENRLRRKADRQGLRLIKSRRRDPDAIDFGGYMLADIQTGGAVLGSGHFLYQADLDEVESYLTGAAASDAVS